MIVYRYGRLTETAFTPRPGKDTAGDHPGLSTFTSLPANHRGQEIETDNLAPPLKAFPDRFDSPQHVSIAPADASGYIDIRALEEWAASRGGQPAHPFTQAVIKAIVRRNVIG